MTAEVVELDSRRPHLVGVAWCPACQHRWVAVVDARWRATSGLECVQCHEQCAMFVEEDR